jgi:hypothetical protein
MSAIEITLLVFIFICVMLMLYTLPGIIEIRNKKIISARKAALYLGITFILPVIGFLLVFPFIKKAS